MASLILLFNSMCIYLKIFEMSSLIHLEAVISSAWSCMAISGVEFQNFHYLFLNAMT